MPYVTVLAKTHSTVKPSGENEKKKYIEYFAKSARLSDVLQYLFEI
jgi:hypothetical protein